MISRTWFIPTSPRSPHKIRNELILLSRFEGHTWDKSAQIEYAKLLESSGFFEGNVSQTLPDLSARDRLRPIYMFGFGYLDSEKKLRITPAGMRLINNIRIEELFFKQLLKWQFPSWQHGGNSRTRYRYVAFQNSDIFPFFETLKLTHRLHGVTKDEIAMFFLPCLTIDDFNQVYEQILEFRQQLQRIRHKTNRLRFIQEQKEEIFQRVYQEDINSGNIRTRESPTDTVSQFINKKIRNSMDYADALIRYFQYTGYFSRTYDQLITSPNKERDIIQLLDIELGIVDYHDVDQFYHYFGNPELPILPWERTDAMETRISAILENIESLIREIIILDQSFQPIPLPAIPQEVSLEQYLDYYNSLELYLKSLYEERLIRDVRRPDIVENIVSTYDEILNREVIDPATYFEWNTWRAILALDDCRARPNFVMDSNLNPLSHAGGRQADIEVDYSEYDVLFEVTLSSGERQFDKEAEPVTRHVAKYKINNPDKTVFGIFIAPNINPNTSHVFYTYFKALEFPDAGHITIIPISLELFIRYLRYSIETNTFNRETFKQILDSVQNLKETATSGAEWYSSIVNIFEQNMTEHIGVESA